MTTVRSLPTVTLPVGEPAASGYQFFAYPLAVLATDPRTTDWVLSNFIQLEYDDRGWDTDVPLTFYLYDYAASPWLEVIRSTRRWCRGADIATTVAEGLAAGYYSYLVVDEYHIPRRRFHQVRSQQHDILVHGVDGATGEFTVLGFDERMRFRSTTVPVEDFRRAYASLDEPAQDNAPVLFYRLRDQPDFGYPPIEYPLDVELVRDTIDEYLRGSDTSRHFRMLRRLRPCTYGVGVYPALEAFLRGYAAGDIAYDIRHVHILWEHKRLMTARLRRLAEVVGPQPALADLGAAAQRVEADARLLRNEMMRDQLQGGRHGFLDRALSLLEGIHDAETALLCAVLRRLDEV